MSTSLFYDAQQIIRAAATHMQLTEEQIQRLIEPERFIEVSLPFVDDAGTRHMVKAYRSQHNSLLGPYKGGFRITSEVSVDEVKALALWMMLKTALVGLPFGGGKGGITMNPKNLSAAELDRLVRLYTRSIADCIGAHRDIPAPDVNTNSTLIDAMVDEYAKTTGLDGHATFTGKSTDNRGLDARGEATGLGGFYVLEALREHAMHNRPAHDMTLAVQGMGNVGLHFAQAAHEAGYKILAMSDSTHAAYNSDGLNPDAVVAYKKTHGTLEGGDWDMLSNERLLELDADVLVPAAVEAVITERNADHIRAAYILELANGPVTSAAHDMLVQRGVSVTPDILANAGGVIGSYLEWRQNTTDERYDHDAARVFIKTSLETAFRAMMDRHQLLQVDLRLAAYICAIQKLSEADQQSS